MAMTDFICSSCNGTGQWHPSSNGLCDRCAGSGSEKTVICDLCQEPINELEPEETRPPEVIPAEWGPEVWSKNGWEGPLEDVCLGCESEWEEAHWKEEN